MNSKNNPVSRKDNLVIQELDGEVLIYDLSENKAFSLNETSALVWQACDGTKSATEISKIIAEKLNSPANEDLVWFALEQLKKEKLLENSHQLPNNFVGLSRREVIKKVGLGSMIALPIVASMVAPVSAQVRSCAQASGIITAVLLDSGNCGQMNVEDSCMAASSNLCCNMTYLTGSASACSNTLNTVTCVCAAIGP